MGRLTLTLALTLTPTLTPTLTLPLTLTLTLTREKPELLSWLQFWQEVQEDPYGSLHTPYRTPTAHHTPLKAPCSTPKTYCTPSPSTPL